MNKLLLCTVCFMLFLITNGNAYAATPISSCYSITGPGEYILTADITDSSSSPCISITSSDVIFDGQGYTIDGVDNFNSKGIYAGSSIPLSNLTVKNLRLTDWDYGMYWHYIYSGTIAENNITSNDMGIYFEYYSTRNTIINNTLNSNRFGTYIWGMSNNNQVINNTANSNSAGGFWIGPNCGSNILKENTAHNNSWAIYIGSAWTNAIINNNLSNNSHTGIILTKYYNWPTSRTNTIKENIINSNTYGITLNDVRGNVIENNTLHSNNIMGLSIGTNSYNNIIKDNTVTSSPYGIYLSSAIDNSIYNNLFNSSTQNFFFSGSSLYNSWNITKTPGNNIIGGKYLGGNVWLSPDGTGFSETCDDVDNDDICDSIFSLASNNIDYLPLIHSVYRNSSIDIPANQPVEINASRIDTILEVTTTQAVQGSIDITKTSSNPSGTSSLSVPSLDTFLEIDISEDIKDNITSMVIKYYYTDEEVTNAGVNENSLGFYWWNETSSSWEMIDESMDWVYGTGVNTVENYVWANVSHSSIYALVEIPWFNAKLIKSKLSPGWRHGSAGSTNSLTAKVRVEGLDLVCRMDYEVLDRSGSIVDTFSSDDIQYAVGDYEIITPWNTPSIPGAYSIKGTLYYGIASGNKQSNYKKLSHIGLV